MSRSRIILLVEDNADDILLTRRAFQQSSVPSEIVTASDGQEALDYLFALGPHAGRDRTIRPAIVLLDLKLPKLDGLDVLRRIRADPGTRRLPVIILTSSNEQRDIVQSYDLGANSFVRKPVNFAQFVDAARHLGVYWLALNEPSPET